MIQLPLTMRSPIDAAVLAACPAPDFATLCDRVAAAAPGATATDIDAAARRLDVEQGDVGRYFYAVLPCALP